jgi:ribose transport system permease protein
MATEPQQAAPAQGGIVAALRHKLFRKDRIRARETGVFIALVVMIIFMSFASPVFLSQGNIFNNLRNATTIAIMAIGVTMVIISGGIDLSVGSVLAVSAMVMARLFYHGAGTIAGLAAGLAFGVFLGVVNSQMVTRIKLPPFIATLGMLSIGRGLTVLFATGLRGSVASNISIDRTLIEFLGGGYIGPVPMPVIIAAVLFAFFGWFLKHTVLGRQVYAVGSNEEAARLSGVNVDRVKLFTYSVTGFLAALAGILQAGLLSTAVTNAGNGQELDVIAAVVIGGASLTGGRGSVWGALIGAMIMTVLRNSFVLLRLPGYAQTISIGVVIILAVALDARNNTDS